MGRKIELLASYWTVAGDAYALGPNEVATFPLKDRIEAIAEVGYKGMGLAYFDLLHNKEKYGYATMKRMLNDHGINHVEVEFLGDWFTTGAKKEASDQVKLDLLEAAHELGARNMKVAGEMWTDVCDVAKFGDAFAEVCVDAAKIGLDVAIEILPVTNIRTMETAVGILERAAQDNGGLCIDIWHMVRGGIDFSKIRALPRTYVKSVEIDDAAAEIQGTMWEDTLFHRLYPGEGVFDCKGFIAAIEATGFDSFYGVEIINEKYRKLPLMEQARRSFEGTMAQFAEIE